MRLRAWAFALLSLLPAAVAIARPGGGDSYSTGDDDGGGGGGGGDEIALLRLLIWLLIEHPMIGVPATIIVALWYWRREHARRSHTGWTAGEAARPSRRPMSARRTLERLRAIDPAFSTVLFEDFASALFVRAHRARGLGELDQWAAFLSPAARAYLSSLGGGRVDAIVVGALTIRSVTGTSAEDAETIVRVDLEANLEEAQSLYATETWIFARSTRARSRTPDRVRTFDCPSCGSKREALRAPKCSYCGAQVDTGAFDWIVTGITGQRSPLPPRLEGGVHERGTHLPTIAEPDARARLDALIARDPAMSWQSVDARVRAIHGELNAAWSSRKLARARPFVTDALFSTLQFWIDRYEREGLTNMLDDARVVRVELAAASEDAHFDALTVRVYATGKDYCVRDRDGAVAFGSRTVDRPYSEYWTLIRGRDVRGAAKGALSCPSCGAALDVGMTGECAYCNAKVTTGAFDWVLSRIEQDESYTG